MKKALFLLLLPSCLQAMPPETEHATAEAVSDSQPMSPIHAAQLALSNRRGELNTQIQKVLEAKGFTALARHYLLQSRGTLPEKAALIEKILNQGSIGKANVLHESFLSKAEQFPLGRSYWGVYCLIRDFDSLTSRHIDCKPTIEPGAIAKGLSEYEACLSRHENLFAQELKDIDRFSADLSRLN